LDISRKGVIRKWRILYNGEIRSLCCLPNIVRVIKSEKVQMVEACNTHSGGKKWHAKFLVIKTQGLDNFKTWTDDEKLLALLNWFSIGSISFYEFYGTHSKEFLHQLYYL
jgi:hypothetical protein